VVAPRPGPAGARAGRIGATPAIRSRATEEVTISSERTAGQVGATGGSSGQAAAIRQFIDDFHPEDEVLAAAHARGTEIGTPSVTPATGATLQWLAHSIHAKHVAEVGTGVGVSGLWLLRGMTDDGVLTTVDDEAENTRAARLTFSDAAIATQRTRLITGRPADVLTRLADAAYDLVFLNGQAQETGRYLEEALRLLRPAGLVLVNHALADGKVPDPAQRDADTVAIRTLLTEVGASDRLHPLLLPVGDGLLVAQAVAGPGPATKPTPPSATATTSNGS
jgi:predicted O-methyltransferase YrrM